MSTEGRIQPGFYQGRAIAGSEQYAQNPSNGNDQIAIDIDVPALSRSFTTFLHFSDAAAPYSIERLRACGWKGTDFAKLSDLDANEITVGIKYETYQGKERMKVDIATGGGRIKLDNQMDEKQKRAFAARMAPLLKGGASAASASSPKPPTNGSGRRASSEPDFDPNAGAGKDEIPF